MRMIFLNKPNEKEREREREVNVLVLIIIAKGSLLYYTEEMKWLCHSIEVTYIF